jgi:hypothetical protein
MLERAARKFQGIIMHLVVLPGDGIGPEITTATTG